MQVTNFPAVQDVAGTIQVEQPVGGANANVKVTNLPLPVVNSGSEPLVVDGQVMLKAGTSHIGSVDVASLPAVKLEDVAVDSAGHLQVDVISQPQVRIDQVKIDPLWNEVWVANFPSIQTVNLANKVVELSSETQANLKSVDARITNSVLTVKDISDNKQVKVTNWPKQIGVAGTVDLPFDTIQDLKVVQVDNFPAIQNVAIPAAHLDSLGRWLVKVDKMPPVKIDDSTPIKVDTELTIENATVTLGNVDRVGEIETLHSITNPVPIDDSTPIRVDVIGVDEVTFTNSSLDTFEQHAYDEEKDVFKVVVKEEPDVVRNVNIVGQPIETEIVNFPAVQTVKATDFDIRPLNYPIDSVTAHIANPVLHVDDNGGSLTVDGAVDVINFPSVYPVTNDGKPLVVQGHVSPHYHMPVLEVTPDLYGEPFPVVAEALDIRSLSASKDSVSIEGGNKKAVNIVGDVSVNNLPTNQDVTVTNIALDEDKHVQADIVSLPKVALDDETLSALENTTVTIDNLPAVQDVNVANQLLLDEDSHGQVDVVSLPKVALDDATLAALEHISIDNLPENQKVTVTNLAFNEAGAVKTSITDLPAVRLDEETLDALEHIKVQVENIPAVQDVKLVNQIEIDAEGHGQVDVKTLPDVRLDAETLNALEHITATIDNFPANQAVTVTNIAVDQDKHQQVDIIQMPSLPAGSNKIGSVDAKITNPVLDVHGTVALDAETLAALEHTTVTVNNLPVVQDVSVVNQIAKDPVTGRAKVDVVEFPSLPAGDNIIGKTHTLGHNYDPENPGHNEIRVNDFGEQYVEVTNLPLIQDVALTNVSQDEEGRINVNIHEMPVVRIDDSTPIKVDTELNIDNATVVLDQITKVESIDSLDRIVNPIQVDDSTPIRVDVIGVDTVTIQSGTLNTYEQNAYDPETNRMKVQVESEPGIRDVNVVNTVLPIAGTVEVENFPKVQEVAAKSLDIRPLNAAQDSVTATIDNPLLPVQVVNLPSVQTVDGTVNIGSLPAVKLDQTANGVNVLSLPELASGDNIIGRVKAIGSNYDENYPGHNEIRVNGSGEQFVQVTNLPEVQRVEVTNPVAVDADKHAQVDVISMPNVTGTVSVDNIPTHFDVTVDNQIATDPATKRAQVDIVSSIPPATTTLGRSRWMEKLLLPTSRRCRRLSLPTLSQR